MTTNTITAARRAFDAHVAQLAGFTNTEVVGMAYALADAMTAAHGTEARLVRKRQDIARAADAVETHLAGRQIEAVECLACVVDADECDACNGRGFTFVDLDTDTVFTRTVGDRLADVEIADR